MIASVAQSGMKLIADEVFLTPELRDHCLSELVSTPVFLVGVHCEFEELERREIARGDRVRGQARAQLGHVHNGVDYDFQVDTTHISPYQAASDVAAAYLDWSGT